MISALAEAWLGLWVRRGRAVLTGLGIGLAAAMLSAALVVGDGLGDGFGRAAAAAHLADVIVRFDPQRADRVAQRIEELPDLKAFSLRQEVTDVEVDGNGHDAGNASAEVVGQGPRGYAIVGGRDVSSRQNEVVLDRGFAAAWGLRLGETVAVGGLPPQRIVGFAEEPDNVAYPLAVPQIYLSQAALGVGSDPQVNEAQLWLRDPRYLDEFLVQARTNSYGLRGKRFITRSGVRVLLDQAAGIVIDLLVALSVIALATAGVMLAASARAEVQRRLGAIGIKRAVGATRLRLASVQALEALLVALPAATVGTVAGLVATVGPSNRLLTMLNEPPAGTSLIGPLVAAWGAAMAIPALAAAWPAWRAAGRPPVELLRGAELRSTRGGRVMIPASLTVLGGRLVGTRRTRWAATAVTLGLSTAFVLLMLALASALSALETDPQELGKRYQLTAVLPASAAARVRRIPGVQAAAPRYEEQAVDSFSLGETIDVIAYPGDHTVFEAPPLAAGRRLRGSHQAEVGVGLADALGPGIDTRHRASIGERAAPGGRGLGQLARPRWAGRLRAGERPAGRRSASPRGARDPPRPERQRDRRDSRAGSFGHAGLGRDRPGRAARHHAPRDSHGGRRPRRLGLRVRAASGMRADGAGAPAHAGGPARLRRGSTGGQAFARRSRSRAPDSRDRPRDCARAAGVSPCPVSPSRELRVASDHGHRHRGRRRAGGCGRRGDRGGSLGFAPGD
jgi:putative ABC transport system permease protein